jgi:hypothetical protein
MRREASGHAYGCRHGRRNPGRAPFVVVLAPLGGVAPVG